MTESYRAASTPSLHEALYTTRAMRRYRPDPIPLDVQARILDAAIRAPSGGNAQAWRFLMVDDPAAKSRMQELYEESITELMKQGYPQELIDAASEATASNPTPPRAQNTVVAHPTPIRDVPLLLFVFNRGDSTGSSSYPAVWSAMLAARGEGVGSTLTAVLHFRREQVFEALGVPTDQGWIMAACITMGYPIGKWSVARRRPAHEVSFRNKWGQPVGFKVPEPLWRPDSTTT